MLRSRTRSTALAALALTVALALLLTPAPPLSAADHGDAPYNSSDQAVDGADAYAFLDPTNNNNVILALTSRGFIAPGENNNFGQFDPAVRYRFELETSGDPRPDRFIDVTFSRRQVTQGTPVQQTATVTMMDGQSFTAPATPPSVCIEGAANCPPAPIVTDFTPTGAPGPVRFFAGMRDDTFNFDIPAFAAATAALRACVAAGSGAPANCVSDALANFSRGRDSFAGYNVMNIVISVPKALFGTVSNLGLGVNGTLARRSPQLFLASPDQVAPGKNYPAVGFGRWVQLDRNGNPAVNAVLIPFNRKDEYNAATTTDDANGRFAADIVASLKALGTNDTNIGILASVVVTNGDQLRLDLSKPNTTVGQGETLSTPSYAGYPNGRRPGDDVVDVILFFVANQQAVTDNANVNEKPIPLTFPFFPAPHQPRPNAAGAEDQTRN
jgi:hypothetical protein